MPSAQLFLNLQFDSYLQKSRQKHYPYYEELMSLYIFEI